MRETGGFSKGVGLLGNSRSGRGDLGHGGRWKQGRCNEFAMVSKVS